METLLAPLREMEEYTQLRLAVDKGETPVTVVGGMEAQKCHMIYGMEDLADVRLIVTYNEIRARELLEDYRLYDKNVMYYPAKDLIFYSADVHGSAIVAERLKAIQALAGDKPVTIITTIDAGMDACVPYEKYESQRIRIEPGDLLNLEEMQHKLSAMGYANVSQVESEGEFSVRGGIIDIYPLTEECPCRIDLWDDEVDTIRRIDVESQRSVEDLSEIEIYPAAEVFMTEDTAVRGLREIRLDMEKTVKELKEQGKNEEAARLRQNIESFEETFHAYHGMVNLESYILYFEKQVVSFFDYFAHRKTLVFLDEPARLVERAETVEYEFRESMSTRLEKGYILPRQMDILYSLPEVMKRLQDNPLVLLTTLDTPISDLTVKHKFFISVQAAPSYNNNFSMLAKDLQRFKKNGYRVLLLSGSETRGRRLCEDLQDFDLTASYEGNFEREIMPGEIMVARGNLRRGFEYPTLRFVVVTEGDIFGAKKKKKRKVKQYNGAAIHSFNDLKIGDYVVHENHGLGIYQGIEKIEKDHVTKDYLKVAYAAGSNLYVPATSLEVLQKYAGSDAKVPKLNRLNSPEWKKTKTRVKGAVKEIAGELVELYAKRQAKKGHCFEKDTVWQKEFEELFPYEETEDQLKAIEVTKADMESSRIMDRLICGDVGYGKTEIAIRAAFKAVMDGCQVAFLVPTTILAAQHYNTFSQRMRDYGINVELLCRLRTPSEQKKTIEGLKKGSVDIVIGTHRLLSKSVSYKNLGLLMIDEEQRFGVTHKERLKEISRGVDVLTLSATPIPRTLNMALSGLRDMSTIEQPPHDRYPVQTFVLEHSDRILDEAIRRELARGGQVYYLHNRVESIDECAAKLKERLGDVSVAVAHGKMNQEQLSDVMQAMSDGQIQILVCTTIIETGIDIPNVNTLIIEDADKLGLAQLHQLRGRVGRSSRHAYAYLTFRRGKVLSEIAEKRLEAIREYAEFGSGFKIAMRDLEIRGAGDLLGSEQSGHMLSVGYDMYLKLLEDAVLEERGEEALKEPECTADLDVTANISKSYVSSGEQRMDLYRRMAAIRTQEDADDLLDEIVDRYGDPPKGVMNLIAIALLRARAAASGIVELNQKGQTLTVKLGVFDFAAISSLCEEASFKGRVFFAAGKTPAITVKLKSGEDALKLAQLLVDRYCLLRNK